LASGFAIADLHHAVGHDHLSRSPGARRHDREDLARVSGQPRRGVSAHRSFAGSCSKYSRMMM
ncbi:MAG: hypothetical protein E5X22_12375, partial [Mesorhizobium sp.]